jgi:phosphatidylinositol alpha-1,6-mannosyltransferase
MRVLVALETRFDQTGDGWVWSLPPTGYTFWDRYLEVFDEVRVVARVRSVAEPSPSMARTDGSGVSFAAVPYFVGPGQYLRRHFAVRRAVRAAIVPASAAILRVPGTLGTVLARAWRATRSPYAAEVVGDPHDVFSPGAVRTPLRALMRRRFCRDLRQQCARATAVAYITDHILQESYPAAPDAYAVACSDIDLPAEAFARQPRLPSSGTRTFHLLLIGSLEQLYKGPDILIRALAIAVARGMDLHLTILGEGRHRPELEQLSRELGLADRVRFAGVLPGGDPVRHMLDNSDLFALPSRAEGQGRALIEAMARGLPCISSSVGGMRELLAPEDQVPPGDAVALAQRIAEVLADRDRLAQMAARNFKRAHDFHADVLRPRRRAFYEVVRDRTLEWQRQVGRR